MYLLEYHTDPARNMEPTFNVEEYIAKYDTVDGLTVARLAAIDECL